MSESVRALSLIVRLVVNGCSETITPQDYLLFSQTVPSCHPIAVISATIHNLPGNILR